MDAVLGHPITHKPVVEIASLGHFVRAVHGVDQRGYRQSQDSDDVQQREQQRHGDEADAHHHVHQGNRRRPCRRNYDAAQHAQQHYGNHERCLEDCRLQGMSRHESRPLAEHQPDDQRHQRPDQADRAAGEQSDEHRHQRTGVSDHRPHPVVIGLRRQGLGSPSQQRVRRRFFTRRRDVGLLLLEVALGQPHAFHFFRRLSFVFRFVWSHGSPPYTICICVTVRTLGGGHRFNRFRFPYPSVLSIMHFESADKEHLVSDAYQVQLPVFEGPLDLLLHLIEEQELDITKVSLAQVTQDYLDYIGRADAVDPDHLADFLVVAAKLIYIKSAVLLPQPLSLDEEEEDVGDDLVRQLRLYKQFKEVAGHLHTLEEQGYRAFVRVAPPPVLPKKVDLDGITLDDLLQAVREALEVLPPAPPVNNVVAPVIITVDEKIDLIRTRLARAKRVSFRKLVRQATSRVEVIVMFLAVLEMIKRGMIHAQQEKLFGDVIIVPAESPRPPAQSDSAS